MTARAGHECRSDPETAVCNEMGRQGLPHEHRSLRFRVRESTGTTVEYAPAIVARRGSILFLVEPIGSARRDLIERLSRFLEQHSPEIVLVVVAADPSVERIPPEAYDEIYAESDIRKMTERIRGQDPSGIVRPFAKPRAHDTPK